VSTTPTRTRAFTLAGIRTKTIPIWDGHIFQYSVANTEDRWGITFEHEAPSLILWEIVEELLEDVHPNYNDANGSR